MKLGIIGVGFVGEALFNGLKESVEVKKIDPKLNTKVKDLVSFEPNIIFICVPTPMNDDQKQDLSILKKVIREIIENNINSMIVLKSTVLPNHINEIQSLVPKLVYNPEFLTEKNALDDFINTNFIILGGNKDYLDDIKQFYLDFTFCKCQEYFTTDLMTASLIKYSINSFLASKVIFFNQLKDIFNLSGTNETWENFISAVSMDERIGSSHMNVPGHDGRNGFGGACFPKDTNAFLEYSKELGAEFSLLKEVIKVNNSIRSSYNDVTAREKDQNTNFE